jgi:hypothetical protein
MAVRPKSETPLTQYKNNEIYMEKEWKNLQNLLNSAATESLGTVKRQNRRKYLKIWEDQIKQLIETKKNHTKMAEFKESRRQTGIQKNHSTGQKRSKKKTKAFLGQICYKFRTRNIHNSTQNI